MNRNHPCLLVLGASHDQLFLIRSAREMGIATAVVDANPNAPGLTESDHAMPVDFSRLHEVYAWVDDLLKKGINVCGVTTMGSDVPHLLAEIADHYGWEGPSRETGRLATNKYLMKRRFLEQGIPVPCFDLVTSEDDVKRHWRQWGCDKLIIKPTDRAGSRGVRLITGESDIPSAFEYAHQNSKIGEVILEEFIEGDQISTESILFDGKHCTPGFADRVYEGMDCFHPQIMENGGWVPSKITGRVRQAVIELVERSSLALGITRGVAKGDVVVHPTRGVMMIEMAARLSGGDFSEGLIPLGYGINYVKAVIRIALGEEPDWDELLPRWQKTVANRYFFLPPGRLEDVQGLERIQGIREIRKIHLSYTVGDFIPEISHHGQRVGVMVVVGRDRRHVQDIIDTAYQELLFKINGQWLNGNPMTKPAFGKFTP
jgi:biotin carboxylase